MADITQGEGQREAQASARAISPDALAPHYSRFRVRERILLTGHSHQAWPDVAFEAQQQAWLDAALLVDDKWQRAAEIADEVRAGWRRLLNDLRGEIALGQNTHELVVRLLSAVLPVARMRERAASHRRRVPRDVLVTSDGEFHTIRRQLARLAEVGVPVITIAARPVDSLAERMASVVDSRTACVLVSSVMYETAEIVPHLDAIAAACAAHGAELLVDAYHHLNVVPFDLGAMGLEHAFVTGGGYKYCQMGEGNCFLRLPPDCEMRPVITGWFSEFGELADAQRPPAVRYGSGAARFAGATYDPTAHYRAAAVFAFHARMQLTVERLRALNQEQIARLEGALRVAGLTEGERGSTIVAMPPERRGGFLAMRTPHAAAVVPLARSRGLYVDARGDILRLGPAPYVSNEQLSRAAGIVADCLDEIASVRR
jgi:kynureninase